MLRLINVTVKPKDPTKRPFSYIVNADFNRPFAFPERTEKGVFEKRKNNPYKLPCGRINVATGDALFHPDYFPAV